MATNCKERSESSAERAAQYRALASFFMDLPSAEGLKAVAAQFDDEGACASPGLQELADFFAETDGADERTLVDVSADRTFLMRGTTKKGPRPPYGSLHSGADPQASMLALKARYCRAGLDSARDTHEAPDYLGVELAFMAAVLERAAMADSGEEARLVALGDEVLGLFIAPLVRSYCPEARGYARTGYCRGMLLVLEEFLEDEAEAAEKRAAACG